MMSRTEASNILRQCRQPLSNSEFDQALDVAISTLDGIPSAAVKRGGQYRCPTCNRCLGKGENFCGRCGTKIIRQ